MTHPAAVTACNLDLENLITDSNRSIATLAITTLLKTGKSSLVWLLPFLTFNVSLLMLSIFNVHLVSLVVIKRCYMLILPILPMCEEWIENASLKFNWDKRTKRT
jgi:hypothetical protein